MMLTIVQHPEMMLFDKERMDDFVMPDIWLVFGGREVQVNAVLLLRRVT
jgi:hypothetical protein